MSMSDGIVTSDAMRSENDDDFEDDIISELLDWVNEEKHPDAEVAPDDDEVSAASTSVWADVVNGSWGKQWWYQMKTNAFNTKKFTTKWRFEALRNAPARGAATGKVKFRLQAKSSSGWVRLKHTNTGKRNFVQQLSTEETWNINLEFKTQDLRFKVKNTGKFNRWCFTGVQNVTSVWKTN